MFIVQNYLLAVVLCFITMLCWGSWANTQKLAGKTWRYELFYWDYVIGILLFSIVLGLTLGSTGEMGRGFLTDLGQISPDNYVSALIGGAIFNLANILLSAAISMAGMTVAFPLGVGIALVLGVIVNYIGAPKGDPFTLFLGVALVMVAIIVNAIASGKMHRGASGGTSKKGAVIAIIAGVLMAFFYRFVAAAMDLDNFESPTPGMATPYSAFFIFAVGIFLSNIVFNTVVMRRPFVGKPVSYSDYFRGRMSTHMVGVLGGIIWGLGTALSYIAAGKAGAAISYALGQGAPMVAALWGIFVWKEFKGASGTVNTLLALMFLFFISGLGAIIVSGAN
ncbi:MAG: multidrug DMT transporter permease [Bacteroidaceae bacterium]|nr:multidrug DMT transporter permease [Bacteroidaceae bacterium]